MDGPCIPQARDSYRAFLPAAFAAAHRLLAISLRRALTAALTFLLLTPVALACAPAAPLMRAHRAIWPARILALAAADILRLIGAPLLGETAAAAPPAMDASS